MIMRSTVSLQCAQIRQQCRTLLGLKWTIDVDSVRSQHRRRRHRCADKTEERIVVIEDFFKSSGAIVVEVRRSSRNATELRDIEGAEVRRIAREEPATRVAGRNASLGSVGGGDFVRPNILHHLIGAGLKPEPHWLGTRGADFMVARQDVRGCCRKYLFDGGGLAWVTAVVAVALSAGPIEYSLSLLFKWREFRIGIRKR